MGYIKLNKQNFFQNLDYFSNICGSKDKLSIALKDNAYGHGTYQVASMCKEYGIKHVFVRDLEEAITIKEFDFETILVLYDIPKTKQDNNFIISINSLEFLEEVPSNSKVELKIDTGMNRNGLFIDEIEKACKLIEKNSLKLNGIFTHFCCSDEDNDITKKQENNFQEAIKETKKYIPYNFRVHCANTTGTLKVDMSKYDLARVGIGSYGYIDIENYQTNLKPVMSLHAKKIATRDIKKGDHLGYGSCAFIAPKDMKVSNYDIGYGDGFYRFSEKLTAPISDGRYILGRVSMDSFSVEGDDSEIIVFDDVRTLAKIQNTITYDILVSLSSKIKRVIS